MTPVSRKYLKEFEEKPKRHNLFGCLCGRRVNKMKQQEFTVIYSPLTRSKSMDDVRVLNPYLKTDYKG